MGPTAGALLGVAALAGLLLGCSPAPPAGGGPPAGQTPGEASPAAPAEPQPQRGGTLKYWGRIPTDHLHPYPVAGPGERWVLGPAYETLLAYKAEPGFDHTQDWETIPWLAESWEQLSPTAYLFRVRKGVRWHDGQEFTGADVKFSYDYARDSAHPFRVRRLVDTIAQVDLLDPSALRINLSQPSVNFLSDLADFNMLLLPKHVLDRGDTFEKVAIGTGPYKLKSYDRTKSAVYTRNESYWQAGKPYPDGVEVVFGLDAAADYAAFVTKNLDLINLNERPRMDQLVQQVPDTQFAAFPGTLGTQWLFKLDRPPFDDVRVRRAIHLALDRQALVKTATFGDGVAQPPVVPPNKGGWAIPQEELLRLPGYRQPKEQDTAEAKRLLAEAGYPQGLKTSVIFGKGYLPAVLNSEPVEAQLRQVGVEVSLQSLTDADYLARERDGSYETVFSTIADPKLSSARTYLHSRGSLNKMGLSDPTLDRLLDEMGALPELAARKRAALELQRYLLDKVYIVPLVTVPVYAAWQPWVKDYVYQRSTAAFFDMLTTARTWLDVDRMPAFRRG